MNRLGGLILLTLALAPTAHAGVIYDNLGSTNSFQHDIGFAIGLTPSAFPQNWWQGSQFTAATSGTVSSLEVSVAYSTTPHETMTFDLYSDDGGTVGSLLEEFSILTTTAFEDGGGAVESVAASGSTFLKSGEAYWLMATSPTLTTWNFSNTGDLLRRAFSPNGFGSALEYSDNDFVGGFRIVSNATSVPEPSSLWLMIAGLLGTVFVRSKRGPKCHGRS